jgi:protein ImuB
MLWLALLLPALPLQLAERALDRALPLAIVDGPPQRLVVLHGNAPAQAAGVVPGMKLAAAQALARGLIALERDAEREAEALAELAGWAYQFSSHVVLQPDGLLLETGASERLFGGRAALHAALLDGLDALGYRARLAYAAAARTARALALAARTATRDGVQAPGGEREVQRLPLTALEWDDATRETLRALGLATVGDVLALPRDAFARRFGAVRLAELDAVRGARIEPLPLFAPPARFAARLELPADLADSAALMHPARRLLASLEGFLRGRNAGATLLRFTATHSARRSGPIAPTEIVLALAAPERDAQRLARLLEERLTRVTLPAPAITLVLAVDELHAFAARNASWLPPAPDAELGADWLQLAETLHARLGSERVFQLQAVDDHRPEHAWRAVPLAVDAGAAPPQPAAPPSPRPLLLLTAPQPLPVAHEAPQCPDALTLVAGPERIECGWWDLGRGAAPVHRDYFVARNGRGQWLWIYRELAAPRGWFLHGLFA